MRIAFLSDIHGNLDALTAVMETIEKMEVSDIFVLGDIFGYYYDAIECLSVLRAKKALIISGNHELNLINILEGVSEESLMSKKYGSSYSSDFQNINTSEVDFLRGLPASRTITIDKHKLPLCHGSPNAVDEYLYPDTNPHYLDQLLDNFDIVACGHSHYQFVHKRVDGRFLFNPGSVGQPRGVERWGLLGLLAN